ncbi:MAG: hypothetical protein LBF27_24430 [Sphingobacterium sp.]|jgi:hypothetical protein|nr:hypothetical protein [Sphingobacterium sp.]
MKRKELLPLFFCLLGGHWCNAQTNIFPATGNVGIGITSPQSKLQVMGGISVNGRNAISGVNNFGNGIQLVDPSHTSIIFNPGQLTQLMFGFHTNGSMYWGNNTTYTMSLSKSGDLRVYNTLAVGSGLRAGYKMSVSGKLAAQEVLVTTSNWPDYVFKSDYKLPSLSETEQFINKNGHLPDVPKASDAEINGISLGEMNNILLKKIEEITLHLIDMEKKNQQQQGVINEQEKRLKRLESGKGNLGELDI